MSVVKRGGTWRLQRAVGGVVTGLDSFYKTRDSLWIGWPGVSKDRVSRRRNSLSKRFEAERCHPVWLSKDDIDKFYRGFSNKTIWPLFHYFPLYTRYDDKWWDSYKRVNRSFCDAVITAARPEDIIWVHDYHLMLLPLLLREKLPDAQVGFFLHIPFPSSELFRLLPGREEILEGMLGSDLLGFHTHDYVHHFLNSVRRILGYEHALGQITFGNRVVRADTFPMGIDYRKFASAVRSPEVGKAIRRIREKVGDRKIILSIDRLDYTKGILPRIEVFDRFLDRNKKYRGKVTLILVAVPSRTLVEDYAALKRRLDELVGRINGKHGMIGWIPIWYLYRSVDFDALVALYRLADVALVTPVRDGMNLISKEFLATKTNRKGVLVLSEMAGAAHELGEALIVNPNNQDEVVRSLERALEMSEDEQIERNWSMQMRLKRYDVVRWGNDFLDRLSTVKKAQKRLQGKKLTSDRERKMLRDYSRSKKRLLLLDYDGTLKPFGEKPQRVRPDDGLLVDLESLSRTAENEVVITSGRDRNTLQKWFGFLSVGLMAEHGVWVKERDSQWEMIEPLRSSWKAEIRPMLEVYVDRTPGSFIEEKEYSLVWHYRRVDLELGRSRSRELKDALIELTSNMNVGVLEGNRVIEIKNTGINKGIGALRWLGKKRWDFILAIGDDWTDEDTFGALPKKSYSIKVGWGATAAKFNVDSVEDVRQIVAKLAGR
jgi:trehalose 6-phosphate synthase/phosphatase